MKRMAIFHELDFGGARRAVTELAKRLSKKFEIDLYYVDETRDNNVRKYIAKELYYPFYPKKWAGNNWKVRLYKDTVELIKLYNLHKKIASDIKLKKYDYIFVHPSKFTQAPFLLSFLKNNCIYYCQEPLRMVYDPAIASNINNISFPKNLYEFLNRNIRKQIDFNNLKNSSIILANSKYSKDFIKKSYGKESEVCYLGVDTDFFKPLNLDKTIDVLFIGKRGEGYSLLNKLSSVFGDKINIKAIFRGEGESSITDKELVEIYNKSKVLIALNFNEPFGLITLEAMACGTPVIAVNQGGYKDSVVNNETGFLISRDSDDLYKKINEVIGNEKLRITIGKNAREKIMENWTWDKSVRRLLKIIKYAN